MSQVTNFIVENTGFPAFRTDLNNILASINTSNSGANRPASAVSGTFWLDTNSATAPILKFYDGSDDITFATFNTTNNTVNISDSATDVVGDTTPQLGGNLDVQTNSIVSTANRDINLTPNGTGQVVIGTSAVSTTFSGTFASLSPSGTFNFKTHQNFLVTLASGQNNFANPTTETVGQSGIFVFIQPSSGSAGTLALGSAGDYETVGGQPINLSTTNDAYDVVPYFVKASGSVLLGTPQLAFA